MDVRLQYLFRRVYLHSIPSYENVVDLGSKCITTLWNDSKDDVWQAEESLVISLQSLAFLNSANFLTGLGVCSAGIINLTLINILSLCTLTPLKPFFVPVSSNKPFMGAFTK